MVGKIIEIGGQKVRLAFKPFELQKQPRFSCGNYNRILERFVNRGEMPISLEFFIRHFHEFPNDYLPASTSLHCSCANHGQSFSEANKEFGNRYTGYFVSETGWNDKILLKIGKKAPMADGNAPRENWKHVDILPLADHMLWFELKITDGKPNCGCEYDRKEKAMVVWPDENALAVSPRLKEGAYTYRNGFFTKSSWDEEGFLSYNERNGSNWNGFLRVNKWFHFSLNLTEDQNYSCIVGRPWADNDSPALILDADAEPLSKRWKEKAAADIMARSAAIRTGIINLLSTPHAMRPEDWKEIDEASKEMRELEENYLAPKAAK
ncbi:MAG: hypothetical protein NTX79_04725 [Candidatus Micrarchaeota archaeon]|nr:hypothetical protein [Candidatus Micrarchaeota archaeon]